jgi:hypothetical protein
MAISFQIRLHLAGGFNPHQTQPVADYLPHIVRQEKPCCAQLGRLCQYEAFIRPVITQIPISMKGRSEVGEEECDPVRFGGFGSCFDNAREIGGFADQGNFFVAE